MSRLLWTPSHRRQEASNIYQFMQRVNASHGLCLEN